MFLPTRIDHIYERVPYATYALIGLNTLIFVFTWSQGGEGLAHVALNTHQFAPHQLLTAMFLHADLFHLLGNMLFLYVYGRYVEERLGPGRYVAGYLLFGIVAAGFYLASDTGMAIGASGAIAGLMGFVLVGAPWAQVRVIFWYYVFVRRYSIAAFWMIGLWLLFQVVDAMAFGRFSRIGYSAHFGGFLAGAGAAALLRSAYCKGTDWWLDPAPPGGGVAATKRLRHARGRTGHRRREPEPESGIPVVFESLSLVPSRVGVIKLLMRHFGMEPDEAHAELVEIDGGTPRRFLLDDESAARSFASKARELGVTVPPVLRRIE